MYVHKFCSLILNCEGADGSTTITDSSSYGNTLVAAGNARIRTADFKVGSASLYIDGTGDYVKTSTILGPGWNWALSGMQATYEAYVRIKAWPAADGLLFGCWRSSTNYRQFGIFISPTGEILLKTSSNGTLVTSAATGVALTLDTWVHVRLMLGGNATTTRNAAIQVDGVTRYATGATLSIAGHTPINCTFNIGGGDAGSDIMSETYYDSVIWQQGVILDAPPTSPITSGSNPIPIRRLITPRRSFPCSTPIFQSQKMTNIANFKGEGTQLYIPPGQLGSIPASPTGTVSGTVTILGIPTARTVRSYRRDTGALVDEVVSNPVTGAYTIAVFSGVEHDLICLDDAAGTVQNDLIKRKTAP